MTFFLCLASLIHFSVTFTHFVRFDSLGLKEGDYVQVEVEGSRIVLTPVAVIKKEKAKSEFFQLVQKLRRNAETLTEEEIEEEIRAALEESRGEK